MYKRDNKRYMDSVDYALLGAPFKMEGRMAHLWDSQVHIWDKPGFGWVVGNSVVVSDNEVTMEGDAYVPPAGSYRFRIKSMKPNKYDRTIW